MRYAVVLLAFTIPKAYELRKDEVDHMYHKARHHSKVRKFEPSAAAAAAYVLLVPALLLLHTSSKHSVSISSHSSLQLFATCALQRGRRAASRC